MKQYLEAAQLYEKGGFGEKAASLYIILKMIPEAMRLVENIKSLKLLSQIAKVRRENTRFYLLIAQSAKRQKTPSKKQNNYTRKPKIEKTSSD